MSQQADFNMSFEELLKLYYADMDPRIRENTLLFGKKPMNSIKPTDIRKWQNELMTKDYSQAYLRTVNNRLAAIFNYATKYYDLKSNPCTKAGSMGKNHADEMNFQTKEEFAKFIDAVMDKHCSYDGFKLLFWTGIRIGELLALTVADIDFEGKTLNISKSYQRIGKKDVVTSTKTPKSNRTIAIPDFLPADLKDYINSMYCVEPSDRLLSCAKHYFDNEMKRGVKRIRLHDTRHSYCALPFEVGIPPLEAAERLVHANISTTFDDDFRQTRKTAF